jgi:thiamine biosynthesis protein ThiS
MSVDDEIRIRVNGEERAVPGGTSVHDFLRALELEPALVVVERNGDILRRDRYAEVRLDAGDALELVHFVGGG